MKAILILSISIILFFTSCTEEKKLNGLWNMTETTCEGFEGIQSYEIFDDEIIIHYEDQDYSFNYTRKRDVIFIYTNPSYDIIKLDDHELILYNFPLECLYYFEKGS